MKIVINAQGMVVGLDASNTPVTAPVPFGIVWSSLTFGPNRREVMEAKRAADYAEYRHRLVRPWLWFKKD